MARILNVVVHITLLHTINIILYEHYACKPQYITNIRLLEIVDYYNYNKSEVCVLMLDATKAFDRVRYCKLFNELLDRDISPVLRILIYIYVHESNIESSMVPDTG